MIDGDKFCLVIVINLTVACVISRFFRFANSTLHRITYGGSCISHSTILDGDCYFEKPVGEVFQIGCL